MDPRSRARRSVDVKRHRTDLGEGAGLLSSDVLDPDLVDQSTAVLARHGRSFSLASAFLPEDRRAGAAVLYAFCRMADDVVDEGDDADDARRAVDRLRRELHGGAPARPLVREVVRWIDPVGVGPALDLLDGVESDLDFRIPDDDDALERYCYQVAGTVGLMMCAVLGVTDRSAWTHAVDLGVGMQLTNICRDVAEDGALGRVYLPRTRLDALGVDPADVQEGRADVRPVVADLLARADGFYASGRLGFPAIPLRSRAGIAVAARLYQGIGHRLRRTGGDPRVGRTVVPAWEKAWLVVRGVADLLGTPRTPRRSLHLPR